MPVRAPVQNFAFTSGMLNTDMESRPDVKAYYSGAKDLTNVVGLPLGGVSTRNGLSREAEITDAAAGAILAKFEFSTDQAYLVIFTHLKVKVFIDGSLQAEIATPYTGADLDALDWTQSLDTMILVHPDHAPRKLMRQGSHTSWAVETLTLTNIPQYDFDGAGGNASENTWSDSRGWPSSVYLYEGRLYFGGSKSRPQTHWGSKTNNFFDFAETNDALDDESVEQTLDGDKVNAIQQLYGQTGLFSFTSGGVFATRESPITPKNFYSPRYSEIPAANIRPVEIEGGMAFVTRDEGGAGEVHQTLVELIWDAANEIYVPQDLALLSHHLLRNPVDMSVRLSNDKNTANHVFVVNGDGTVAVLNSKRSQQVTGWTLFDTKGQVLRCAVVINKAWFLVKRSINGVDRYFLEKLNPEHRLDCSLILENPTEQVVWSGLGHLENEMVSVHNEGADMGLHLVTGGSITVPYPVKKIEVGLPFDWVVETMPVEAQLTNGTLIGESHRITKATVRVRDAHVLNVNGREISFAKLDEYKLGDPPPSFTGPKRIRFLGWNSGRTGIGATVRITGSSVLPATILSVTATVAQ